MPRLLGMTDQRPLTTGQVAERFGVHPTTVIAWADAGKIPFFRTPGGDRRFHVADVEALLTPTTTDPEAAA